MFKPTDQGILTSEKLAEFFSEFINVEYTAEMENNLDEISKGQKVWYDELKVFYDHLCQCLKMLKKIMEKIAPVEIGEECPECGSPLVIRRGRYGEFVACSGYPTCKYIKKETKRRGCTRFRQELNVRNVKKVKSLKRKHAVEKSSMDVINIQAVIMHFGINQLIKMSKMR